MPVLVQTFIKEDEKEEDEEKKEKEEKKSSPVWSPKKRSPFKPIYVGIGKEKIVLDVGSQMMCQVFAALPMSFRVRSKLINVTNTFVVLTSDSVPLQYILGTKMGNTDHRGAFEFESSAKSFSTRFRQHRVICHTQEDFMKKWNWDQASLSNLYYRFKTICSVK